MFPPFKLSVFADPAGSFTTAGAMVACVERVLKEKKRRDLKDLAVAVFGATGVVGFAAAVIARGSGRKSTLVGYDGPGRVARARPRSRSDSTSMSMSPTAAPRRRRPDARRGGGVLHGRRAGLQVLSKSRSMRRRDLLVAADVNAVPPTGVEGLDMKANGDPIGRAARWASARSPSAT